MYELVLIIAVAEGSVVIRLVVTWPDKNRPKPDPKGFNANYGYD